MLGTITTFFMNMHSRILLSQTPNPLRGRIQGLAQFAIGFFPMGALLVGILGDNIGILNNENIFKFGNNYNDFCTHILETYGVRYE